MHNKSKFLFLLIASVLVIGIATSSTCLGKNVRTNIQLPVVRPGLDPHSWNSALFINKKEAIFGVRVGLMVDDTYISGRNVYKAVKKVGARTPDGSYANLVFGKGDRKVNLKWSALGPNTITCVVTTTKNNTTVAIEGYFPWSYSGKYSVKEKSILGKAPATMGNQNNYSYLHLKANKTPQARGTTGIESIREYPKRAYPTYNRLYAAIKYGVSMDGNTAAYLKYELDKGEVLVFKAKMDGEYLEEINIDQEEITSHINNSRKLYHNNRFRGKGPIGKTASSIIDEEFWMYVYQPNFGTRAETPRTYPPPGRTWVKGSWASWCWDPMFQSAVASFQSEFGAYSAIFSTLGPTQQNNGIIPNDYQAYVWNKDGMDSNQHSQPPVASYFVWKLYLKFKNKKFLRESYPPLKRWYKWWSGTDKQNHPRRDGNGDCLYEWGADPMYQSAGKSKMKRIAAHWETGLDDSPMWDDIEMKGLHMNLNSIWLNCLRTLDSRMMAKIAREIGKVSQASRFMEDYKRKKELINERLWNKKEQMYLSRYWNGKWERDQGIPTITPASFTALLAGIPTEKRAKKIVTRHLLNPDEFWGDYIIPTVNKNHPDYASPYTYWRGAIWPPTNYLVYEGLKKYGFDMVAAILARKSTELWLKPWQKKNWAVESYNPETGLRSRQARIHQGWSMNLPLIGIQEMIDVEQAGQNRFAIRSSNLGLQKANSLRNVSIQGHEYGVEAGPAKIVLYRDGKKILKLSGGGVVVREFTYSSDHISFTVKAQKKIKVKVKTVGEKVKTTHLKAGINEVELEDGKLKSVRKSGVNWLL